MEDTKKKKRGQFGGHSHSPTEAEIKRWKAQKATDPRNKGLKE